MKSFEQSSPSVVVSFQPTPTAESVVERLITLVNEVERTRVAKPAENLRSVVEEVCGAAPTVLSWDNAQMVKEPRFWLLYFDGKLPSDAGTGTRESRTSDASANTH